MKKVQDYYFKKAKKEGYPARSVYKLEETDRKYHLLRKGDTVLDLGAYPGSWTRYAARIAGPGGLVVAVDLRRVRDMGKNVKNLEANVLEIDPARLRRIRRHFDVVLSDMAPKTTGRRDVDHYRSVELAERALFLAEELLARRGTFFCKIFQGEDLPAFRDRCREQFDSVRMVKPKSSRPESVEVFLLCRCFSPPRS
ncbi:MAG TPA: RlmE family RNA methyltransferase [Thermodesulfobacteriaceae bacterium]|nr:RlmE family RNA methyltransferase [Thermodesulfobacteriaceae bacterium]